MIRLLFAALLCASSSGPALAAALLQAAAAPASPASIGLPAAPLSGPGALPGWGALEPAALLSGPNAPSPLPALPSPLTPKLDTPAPGSPAASLAAGAAQPQALPLSRPAAALRSAELPPALALPAGLGTRAVGRTLPSPAAAAAQGLALSAPVGPDSRQSPPAAISGLKLLAEAAGASLQGRSGGAAGALSRFSMGFDGAAPAPPLPEESEAPPRRAAYDPAAPGVVDALIASKEPVVVAHGKNDYTGVAGESTWGNLAHSVESARGNPVVLEADIRRTRDGFIVFHDPTFHVGVRDYRTPQSRIDAFRRENPELTRSKEGSWDFLLLDGVDGFGRDELEGIRLLDRPTGREFPLIRLSGLLGSVETPGKLRIPEHAYEARGPPAERGVAPARTVDAGPVALYLDYKEINHLARRLYGLSDWHWIIASWSTARIEDFTRAALADLSSELHRGRAHAKSFIAVRHPRVAALAREVDPGIRLMASPDDVGPEASAEEWIRSMESFLTYRPDLIEIKYLKHMRDPKIRAWARARGLKILYDQIPQTDAAQFEGVYRDDLGRLTRDIVEEGRDVMIQTNTPDALREHLGPRR